MISKLFIRTLVIVWFLSTTLTQVYPDHMDEQTAGLIRLMEWRDPATNVRLGFEKPETLPELHQAVLEIKMVNHLDLRAKNLTVLPPEIGYMTGLESLIISSNQLTEIPSETGKLSNLVSLHMDSNQLTSLPPQISNLSNLENLNLSNVSFG